MLDAGIIFSKENIDIGRLDSLLRVLFIHHSPLFTIFFCSCLLGAWRVFNAKAFIFEKHPRSRSGPDFVAPKHESIRDPIPFVLEGRGQFASLFDSSHHSCFSERGGLDGLTITQMTEIAFCVIEKASDFSIDLHVLLQV
jgi:hypothetical protein